MIMMFHGFFYCSNTKLNNRSYPQPYPKMNYTIFTGCVNRGGLDAGGVGGWAVRPFVRSSPFFFLQKTSRRKICLQPMQYPTHIHLYIFFFFFLLTNSEWIERKESLFRCVLGGV